MNPTEYVGKFMDRLIEAMKPETKEERWARMMEEEAELEKLEKKEPNGQ